MNAPRSTDNFTVVGIGASAGGLEAFSDVLRALGDARGVALVFIQHLTPKHVNILPDLLVSATRLPVVTIAHGMTLQENTLYVLPPDVVARLDGGTFVTTERGAGTEGYTPVDTFFRSLAEHAKNRAVGVILSGTLTDGLAGLVDIKAAGGTTIVQDPSTAKFDAMPRAVMATGAADLVRTPEEIARDLLDLAVHPYSSRVRPDGGEDELSVAEDQSRRMFSLLQNVSGIDFSHYKQPTIRRRLQRRMMLRRVSSVERYIQLLGEDKNEARNLTRDILIHVTRFFREPESFETLKDVVFSEFGTRVDAEGPIRIWVPGCSTGEEPYSVAIALLEALGGGARIPIQIFATDVSEPAIDAARAGLYPESIAANVSPERLRLYFTRTEGQYRISKQVRDLCIFARQDITRDPPFSKLDLIVCRNLLIYLDQALQRRLMTIFHYGLKSSGYLMLSSSETIGANADYFTLADKRHKLYAKKTNALPVNMKFSDVEYPIEAPIRRRDDLDRGMQLQAEAGRMLLGRFSPPGVLVDAGFEILQFHGRTGDYLEAQPGGPTRNLMKMLREGLIHGVRSAFLEARRTGVDAEVDNLSVALSGGERLSMRVQVVPLAGSAREHFLVLFHEHGRAQAGSLRRPSSPNRGGSELATEGRDPDGGGPDEALEIRRLRDELAASRDYLQSIIHDLEATNEELQSANEEILSSNEELQSTNEELDTAKEELQSTNEELNTVNDELHARNDELSRVNSDLLNFLGTVQIAVVMVANDLRIRRFTPMAQEVLNLIPSDVGRPITHIKPNINCPDLEGLVRVAVATASLHECEVQDAQGNSYLLRIRPYRDAQDRVDGAVLALIELTERR